MAKTLVLELQDGTIIVGVGNDAVLAQVVDALDDLFVLFKSDDQA